MKEYINALDNLPVLIKAVLAFFLDILWHIYRIIHALADNDSTALVVAIVLCVIPFMGIIDIVMILLKGNVWRYQSAK